MFLSAKRAICLGAALAAMLAIPMAVNAQSRVPTVPFVKKVLISTKGRWISFRNYSGQQLIYFTHLLSWKCGISELHYSINGRALDQRWAVPHCNPLVPYNIDPKTKTHLTLPLGGAKSLSVQVIFKDGSKSAVRSFGPCNVTGDTTCGVPIQESDRAQEKTAGGGGSESSSGSSASSGSSGSAASRGTTGTKPQ